MNYNCNFINLNIIFNTWKTTKSIHVVGAKGPFFAIYTPPLHHVTILYLKKGQRLPQGNEPFFDPFSGTKRHVTVWTNQRVSTKNLTPPFRPYFFISIGLEKFLDKILKIVFSPG
jgi:hypothetical protein